MKSFFKYKTVLVCLVALFAVGGLVRCVNNFHLQEVLVSNFASIDSSPAKKSQQVVSAESNTSVQPDDSWHVYVCVYVVVAGAALCIVWESIKGIIEKLEDYWKNEIIRRKLYKPLPYIHTKANNLSASQSEKSAGDIASELALSSKAKNTNIPFKENFANDVTLNSNVMLGDSSHSLKKNTTCKTKVNKDVDTNEGNTKTSSQKTEASNLVIMIYQPPCSEFFGIAPSELNKDVAPNPVVTGNIHFRLWHILNTKKELKKLITPSCSFEKSVVYTKISQSKKLSDIAPSSKVKNTEDASSEKLPKAGASGLVVAIYKPLYFPKPKTSNIAEQTRFALHTTGPSFSTNQQNDDIASNPVFSNFENSSNIPPPSVKFLEFSWWCNFFRSCKKKPVPEDRCKRECLL